MKLIVTFIVGATLANGLLAGGDADRWFVGMPAWQSVGLLAWANYSRSADLGNGFVLYPMLAIRVSDFTMSANQSLKPTQPLGLRLQRNRDLCFKWLDDAASSR
jgi:hypothetical protein